MNGIDDFKSKEAYLIDLGLCDFERALIIQKNLHQKRINRSIPDTMVFVEHPPVITFGKSSNYNNLLFPTEFLSKQGIRVYHIERGGDVTFHGPGQLVGYPIFYIKDSLAGIKGMIEKLHLSLILTLKDFGLVAQVKPKYIGVWIDDEKIASIGIAVKKWVSFHGFALNVTTDLSYFDMIIPCGLSAIKMTSMEKILREKISLVSVYERVKVNLERVFEKKFNPIKNSTEFTT